jgi:hypothetical protein
MKINKIIFYLFILIFNHSIFANSMHNNGNVIMDNNTDYAIIPHIDDYNYTLITNMKIIPPHTQKIIMLHYAFINQAVKSQLMFDIQLGAGIRNWHNTSIITYDVVNYNKYGIDIDPYIISANPETLFIVESIKNPDSNNGNLEISINPVD